MKRRIFSVFFALVLVLSMSLVTAVPVGAATDRLVPGSFATIQLAIDGADPGDTIIVSAGTYAENLVIDKALTLKSVAGAGSTTIDASATTVTNQRGAIQIAATVCDVTIGGAGVGFTIKAPGTVVGDGGQYGVEIGLNCDRARIEDNIISGDVQVGVHIWGAGADAHEDIIIKDNTITTDETAPVGGCYGIITAPIDQALTLFGDASLIDGNTISGFSGTAIYLDGVDGTSTSLPIVVSDNTVYDNTVHGLVVVGCEVSVTGNTIYNNTVNGITIGETHTTTEINVATNSIYSNTGWGIRIYSGDGANVDVGDNNIYSNTLGGLLHGGTGTCPATSNCWGPAVTTTSAVETLVSGDVDYSPWLVTSPITGAAPTIVASSHPWTWYTNTTKSSTIQHAITAATAGDTILVHAETYTEQVYINKANLTVESVAGATTTIIDGTGVTDANLITGHAGLVWLQKDGITFEGFTVQGIPVDWGNGGVVYLQGWNGSTTVDDITGCTITANTITLSNTGDNGIVVEGAADSNIISDNTITVSGTGGAGIIMAGKAGNDTTGNQITGNIITSIATKYGISLNTDDVPNQRNFPGTVISGNTISGDGNGIGLYYATGSSASHIVIQNNTISGLSTSDGDGIELYHGAYVDILRNTLRSNAVGVQVKEAGSTNVVVNYNEFDENTVGVDVLNLPGTLDAQYNWWDAVAGPDNAKNPYDTQASGVGAEVCTTGVDFTPWMIHTSLASGWNIYSTPIACGDTTDTITEALDLWTDDTATAAYYFDGSSQAFAIATNLTPLQAVYLNMSAAATIDVISSTSHIAPPSQTAHDGWNLIGLAELYNMDVEDAVASAYYVAGANNIGYSQVVSPGLGQTAWSAMRGALIDTISGKGMAPCEGYWMNMVNQGILAGFTSTPITELP